MGSQGHAWRLWRPLAVVVAPLVVAGALSAAGWSAASAAACRDWTSPPRNPGNGGDTFYGVSVLSACNAWAVGQIGLGQTLIEHWNGSSWKVQPSPSVGGGVNVLTSVSAISAANVWAVGYYSTPAGSDTLILHWAGRAWRRVRSPSPGLAYNELHGVHATSAHDVWAVGSDTDSTDTNFRQSLILHWDGHAWSPFTSPDPGPEFNALSSVTATSARNAWAAGEFFDGTRLHTLTAHWNGRRWTHVTSPSPGTSDDNLTGVSAASAASVWAVGYTNNGNTHTLILHWNGRRWAHVTSPNPGPPGSFNHILWGTAAFSATSAWAAGAFQTSTGSRTMLLHWNGRNWRRVSFPNPGATNNLFGVAATTASDAWAVGDYSNGTGVKTLASHCC